MRMKISISYVKADLVFSYESLMDEVKVFKESGVTMVKYIKRAGAK